MSDRTARHSTLVISMHEQSLSCNKWKLITRELLLPLIDWLHMYLSDEIFMSDSLSLIIAIA